MNKPEIMKSLRRKRKLGTVNQGFEYESKMCALISLRGVTLQNKIKNFWLTQNIDDPSVGKFDDIVLVVQKLDNVEYTYCCQLKHFGPNKRHEVLTFNLFQDQFTKKNKHKNQLYLEEYFQSISESLEHVKSDCNDTNIEYILFTNRPKDDSEERFILCDYNEDYFLLNTEGIMFKFNEFRTKRDAERKEKVIDKYILDKFAVFSNQLHEEHLEKLIQRTLQKFVPLDIEQIQEATTKYLKYITDWTKGNFGNDTALSQDEITMKLCEFLIHPYLFRIPRYSLTVSKNTLFLWQNIANKYKIVLVDKFNFPKSLEETRAVLISNCLWSALQYFTMVTDWKETLTEEHKKNFYLKLKNVNKCKKELESLWGCDYELDINVSKVHFYLWKKKKVSLILRIESIDQLEAILRIIKLMPGRCTIFYTGNLSQNPPTFITESNKDNQNTIFYNFFNLNNSDKEIILQHCITIQGRKGKIKDVLLNDTIKSLLFVNDIANILLNKYNLSNTNFKLPNLYIDRFLNTILINSDLFKKRTLYIVCCNSRAIFEDYAEKCNINISNANIFTLSKVSSDLDGHEQISTTNLLSLFTEHKILINIDFKLCDIISEVNKNRDVNIEYRLYELEKSQDEFSITASNSNPIQIIHVIVCKYEELQIFFKSHNIPIDEYEIYENTQINFYNIPFTCKFILLNDDITELYLTPYFNKNISYHCYKLHTMQNYFLEYLGSVGKCNEIFNYMENTFTFKHKFDYMNLFWYNNLNIITGCPGMGKSVLINYLLKICPLKFWSLLLNFNFHMKYFMENSFIPDNIFAHIRYFLNYDNSCYIEKRCIDDYLKNKNICLFLDGYDEIHPELEIKICDFINILLNEGFTLFITTRNVKSKILQQNFNCVARHIAPFTKGDQENYITQYFIKKIAAKEERVQEFVKNLITMNTDKMSAWDIAFCGIPLQTVMISEIYLEECEKFCLTANNKIHLNFDILHLYDQFFKLKISNLKFRDKMDNPSAEIYFNKIMKNSLDNHKLCAIKAIFPEDFCEVNIVNFINEIKEGKDKIGLIDSFLSDNTPVFVHRTFAEYLVALFIADNLEMQLAKKLHKIVLLESTYDIIRQILDRLLSDGCVLHKALLNKNLDDFKVLMKDKKYLTAVDSGGRNILHIAMSWGIRHYIPSVATLKALNTEFYWNLFENMLEEVNKNCKPDCDGSCNFVDFILGTSENLLFDLDAFEMTPLDYGIQALALKNINTYLAKVLRIFGNFKTIEEELKSLFKYDGNIILSLFLRENPASKCTTEQLLFVSSMYNYSNIVLAILQRKPYFHHLFDTNFCDGITSVLHLATWFKADDVIDILATKYIYINVIEQRWNQSALHWASVKGHVSTVKLLLERHADVTLLDKYGKSSLYLASFNQKHDVIDLLTDAEHKCGGKKTIITKLCMASVTGDFEEVCALLRSGEDPNEAADGGRKPLMVASVKGFSEVAALLLEFGAEVNALADNNWSALMYASRTGQEKVVKILLDAGANAHKQDRIGRSALSLAELYKHTEVIQLLKEAGAVK